MFPTFLTKTSYSAGNLRTSGENGIISICFKIAPFEIELPVAGLELKWCLFMAKLSPGVTELLPLKVKRDKVDAKINTLYTERSEAGRIK
jgi:hypothetical protein